MYPPPPSSTLFPYTTLFRSENNRDIRQNEKIQNDSQGKEKMMGQEGKTAADIMVESLIDWGVEVIFGMPGDGINGIMESLRTHQDRKSTRLNSSHVKISYAV